MDITNDKIYLELLKIKKLLRESLDLEREIVETTEQIKIFEGQQAYKEDKIVAAVKKKKFSTVYDWKRVIWDHCDAKKENISQTTISFYCEILKGPCSFEKCPKNILDED